MAGFIALVNGSASHIPLKDGSVQCCVTSPPYYGLRKYDGQQGIAWPAVTYHPMPGLPEMTVPEWRGDLGLEPAPEMYVGHLVLIFREVWRALRKDGTCWLDLGDSFVGGGGYSPNAPSNQSGSIQSMQKGSIGGNIKPKDGLKSKDLMGIPWRVAFALQADGWYLRLDIIWAKPNPLPESVRDRCTKAHEYIFMLAKSERYFYDNEAIKEPVADSSIARIQQETFWQQEGGEKDYANGTNPNRSMRKTVENFARSSRDNFRREDSKRGQVIPGQAMGTHRPDRADSDYNLATRNKRSVWSVPTKPYPGSHYAVFPEALIEPMILASTSEYGACPECGRPWERVVEQPDFSEQPKRATTKGDGTPDPRGYKTSAGQAWQEWRNANPDVTTGWRPTCGCHVDPEGNEREPLPPVPCIVCDPFCGSGTTGVVARKHGRSAVLLDISQPYLSEQARARLELDKIDAWQSGKAFVKEDAPLADLPLFTTKETT